MKYTNMIGSALIAIVVAAISALFLLKNESQPVVQAELTKKTVASKEMSILLNSKDAAKLLGMTEDQLKRIIFLEDRQLEQYGSFNGTRLPYITIDEEYFFNPQSLMLWATEASNDLRNYDEMVGQ